MPTERTREILAGPADELERLLDGQIDEAAARGWPRLRLTGETVCALLPSGEADRVMAFERATERVLRRHPSTRLLCRYDRRRWNERAIDEMRRMHDTELVSPAVYDDNLLRITRNGPSTARLAGEIDHSNRLRIRTLLETMLDQTLRSHSAPDRHRARPVLAAFPRRRRARSARCTRPRSSPAPTGCGWSGCAPGCCGCSTGAARRSPPSWWSRRTPSPDDPHARLARAGAGRSGEGAGHPRARTPCGCATPPASTTRTRRWSRRSSRWSRRARAAASRWWSACGRSPRRRCGTCSGDAVELVPLAQPDGAEPGSGQTVASRRARQLRALTEGGARPVTVDRRAHQPVRRVRRQLLDRARRRDERGAEPSSRSP